MSRPTAQEAENLGLAIVQEWHDALNAGEIDRLMATMTADVAFRGPRGEGHGADLVRDWAQRAGIQLHPARWFHGGDAIVVTQQARWRDPESGEWGDPIPIASAFHLRDGRITRITRHGTVDEALAAADLDESAVLRSTP